MADVGTSTAPPVHQDSRRRRGGMHQLLAQPERLDQLQRFRTSYQYRFRPDVDPQVGVAEAHTGDLAAQP